MNKHWIVKKTEENGLLNVYIDSLNEFIQITNYLHCNPTGSKLFKLKFILFLRNYNWNDMWLFCETANTNDYFILFDRMLATAVPPRIGQWKLIPSLSFILSFTIRAKLWEGRKHRLGTFLMKITTFYGETCWKAIF